MSDKGSRAFASEILIDDAMSALVPVVDLVLTVKNDVQRHIRAAIVLSENNESAPHLDKAMSMLDSIDAEMRTVREAALGAFNRLERFQGHDTTFDEEEPSPSTAD